MKKILFILLTLSVFSTNSSYGCTSFQLYKDSTVVVGYSFDWFAGMGKMITNNRNVQKEALIIGDENPVKWMSKYGSITFCLMGKDFPFAGMNEKGLVVTQMWLNKTQYPEKDYRSSLTELQWIQYQLDNCSTVEEVIATTFEIRISRNSAAPLHFFVSDRSGNSASIEFLEGKTVVNKGKKRTTAVLTNSPYVNSVEKLNMLENTHFDSIPDRYRFGKACYMLDQYYASSGGEIIDQAFQILHEVKQRHTKWNIVFDQLSGKIYFKTFVNKKIQQLNVYDYEYNCEQPVLYADINKALPAKVLKDSYSKEIHTAYIKNLHAKMVKAPVSESYWKKLMEYYKPAVCVK